MKFYALYEVLTENMKSRIDFLQNACTVRNIEFVAINSLDFDYSNIPILSKKDLLYNLGRGSETLESLLLNDEVTTFYIQTPQLICNQSDSTKYSILHDKIDIPAPKTIYRLTADKTLLEKYVAHLNGFPVILKVVGGTLGIGTIKIDNFQTLFSIADHLCSNKTEFVIRQYIEPKEVARLIVLGDTVIASNQKFIADNDFRTSIKHKPPLPKNYSKEIEAMVVKATRFINFEQAGADIIIDRNDNPYLLEINSPHDFSTTQNVTGIDIAGQMIDFLIRKSERK